MQPWNTDNHTAPVGKKILPTNKKILSTVCFRVDAQLEMN